MSNVCLLEADDQRPKFRQAQPLRHLAVEDPSFTLAPGPFSSNDKHKPCVACGRSPQETQKLRVRFVLRQPMQIETDVDCLFASGDPRAHAASERCEGRRRPGACRFSQSCFFCRRCFNLRSDPFHHFSDFWGVRLTQWRNRFRDGGPQHPLFCREGATPFAVAGLHRANDAAWQAARARFRSCLNGPQQ